MKTLSMRIKEVNPGTFFTSRFIAADVVANDNGVEHHVESFIFTSDNIHKTSAKVKVLKKEWEARGFEAVGNWETD